MSVLLHPEPKEVLVSHIIILFISITWLNDKTKVPVVDDMYKNKFSSIKIHNYS